MQPTIIDNYQSLQQQLQDACAQAEHGQTVRLLAVSKTKPISDIQALYQAGQREFGENYVQELVTKATALAHLDLCWHFIGALQSNKTKLVAAHAHWLLSLDNLKIMRRLNQQRPMQMPPLQVCLQINIDAEPQKAGIAADELLPFADEVSRQPQLQLRGIMALPNPALDTQRSFERMHQLFQQLQIHYPQCDTLSIGMSRDLQAAIACGSTLVRIGTALFGARTQPSP
jgi:pyridoxal phosphate enzyme (YggS family)